MSVLKIFIAIFKSVITTLSFLGTMQRYSNLSLRLSWINEGVTIEKNFIFQWKTIAHPSDSIPKLVIVGIIDSSLAHSLCSLHT